MNDIIEIIARAIVKHDDGCDWDTMSERARDWEMGVAQAAIAGLAEAGYVIVPREPGMVEISAGIDAMWPGDIVYPDEHSGPEAAVQSAYRAMINAADFILPPPVRDAGPLESEEGE